MKMILTILLTVFCLDSFCQTKYTIWPAADGSIFMPTTSQFKSGDTLYLNGIYTSVYFNGLHGDSAKRIIIDGRSATVGGYDLKDCYGVRLLNGVTGSSGGVGISLHGFVNHIEVAGGEIRNSEYGLWCKNEPRSFDDSIYSHTVLNDVYVHDVWVHDIAQHFCYFGATEYPNTDRGAIIDGVTYYFQPSLLSNIRINHNKIERCGKNGPMLCLASSGFNEIAYNDISFVGLVQAADQGTGIAAGGYTEVYIHDNNIRYSWQPNIWSFGGRNVRIENNNCSLSGNIGTATQAWPENIRLQCDPKYTDSIQFSVKNNPTQSIAVYKGTGKYCTTNEVCSNGSAIIRVDAGITYSTCTILPIDTSTKQPPPTNHKKYHAKVTSLRTGFVIKDKSNEWVDLDELKKQLPKRRFLVIEYWDDKKKYDPVKLIIE